MRKGNKWRIERMGLFWFARKLGGRIVDYNVDERDGDARVFINGNLIYIDCVSTYQPLFEQRPFAFGVSGVTESRNESIKRIYTVVAKKINKQYADNRALLIIIDHPFPIGRLTLRHVFANIQKLNIRCFCNVYMVELLTRNVRVIK